MAIFNLKQRPMVNHKIFQPIKPATVPFQSHLYIDLTLKLYAVILALIDSNRLPSTISIVTYKMADTRTRTKIFLLNKTCEKIRDNQLPTNGDVLQHFYFLKAEYPKMAEKYLICCGISKKHALNCGENCLCLVSKITSIYEKAGLETIRVDVVQKEINDLLSKYKQLVSLQKRSSSTEVDKRNDVINNFLPSLFEIMPGDIITTIEKDKKRTRESVMEDISFINDQRGSRKMFIGTADKKYISTAQISQKRRKQYSKTPAADPGPSTSQVVLSSTSSEADTPEGSSRDISIESEDLESEEEKVPKGKLVADTVLASKVKHVSVRTQSDILLQAASSSGITTKGMSKSNVHRVGKKVVHEHAEKARQIVRDKRGSDMVLHYDGKVVEEYTEEKKLKKERLAVSITCKGKHFLLGVPSCTDATGEKQYEKIIDLLQKYQIKDDIKGLVFDTTASNTGKDKGVNSRLNQYVERPVLHLACRHHVYECHIKNVAKIFRQTVGPENPLFKKLLDKFSELEIDQTKLVKFQYGKSDQLDSAAAKSLKIISELLTQDQIPRGDYKELAMLVQFYLDPNVGNLKIRQPGAVHHARFMA